VWLEPCEGIADTVAAKTKKPSANEDIVATEKLSLTAPYKYQFCSVFGKRAVLRFQTISLLSANPANCERP
jgi:hypothetical protein